MAEFDGLWLLTMERDVFDEMERIKKYEASRTRELLLSWRIRCDYIDVRGDMFKGRRRM